MIAPESEAYIRELVRAGHDASLRIRRLETLIHVHVQMDGYHVAADVVIEAIHQDHFDQQVRRLISICERKPDPTDIHANCDCAR